jgi:hypothetical protein
VGGEGVEAGDDAGLRTKHGAGSSPPTFGGGA